MLHRYYGFFATTPDGRLFSYNNPVGAFEIKKGKPFLVSRWGRIKYEKKVRRNPYTGKFLKPLEGFCWESLPNFSAKGKYSSIGIFRKSVYKIIGKKVKLRFFLKKLPQSHLIQKAKYNCSYRNIFDEEETNNTKKSG